MKSTLLIASAALNLGLLGALAFYTRTPSPPPPPAATAPTPAKSTTSNSARQVQPFAPAPGQFDWQMVESADYRKYIASLRAIGCPEETIRDLIIADVNKFYFHKIESLAVRARDFKFWQTGISRTKINLDNRRQVQVLDQEKWTLLRDLLGADAEQDYRKTAFPADYLNEELTLGFLPEARRGPVREVVDRYSALERELQARGSLQPKDRAELKRLRDQRQAELAAILSPSELEEYELRNSTTADSLRVRLAGFQPTEEQFRQLFLAQKTYDDNFGNGFFSTSPGEIEKRAVAQKQLEEQAKNALGEPFYNEYKRAQDPAYRAVVDVARDLNLPPDTAGKVYDIKKAVDDQVQALLTDGSVPKSERMTALRAISEETEKALLQTLGEAGYNAYKQNGGNWVPAVNGNTFTYTSSGGDTLGIRSFKISDVTTTTGAPGANANLKVVPASP